jgi:hypothetical protein
MIEEVALGLRELSNWSLNEVQFILYQYFGYDTFNKKWFQHWCEEVGHRVEPDYSTLHEDVQYNCERCGKRYL